MKKSVSEKMDKAKLDIEDRLLPKGKDVVRHLSLPAQGRSLEWILEEMKNMDTEMGGNIQPWNQGKISGAVYRTSVNPSKFQTESNYFTRWGRRTREDYCCCTVSILPFQSASSRTISRSQEDGG